MKVRALRIFSPAAVFVWILCAATVLPAQETRVSADPQAGLYRTEVTVQLTAAKDDAELYYRFASSDTKRWIPYYFPIELPAEKGSEKQYELELGIEDGDGIASAGTRTYTIDRRPPGSPEIELQRRGNGGLRIRLDAENAATLYYWHTALDTTEYRKWNGSPLQLSPDDSPAAGLRVQAYAQDAAGNRSSVVSRTETSFDSPSSPQELTVPSPVEGSFSNPQLLYIQESERFDWVRYTVNGDDPVYRGAVYSEPVLLRARGEYELRVAARRRNGETIRLQRRFTIAEEAPLLFDFSSGQLQRPQKVEPPDTKKGYILYHSREDRAVTENDPFFSSPVDLFTTVPVIQSRALRIGVFDPQTGRMHQYRYYFIYDNRVPGPPAVKVRGSLPFQGSVQVEIAGPQGADLYYTLDGSTPDEFSNRYNGPITLDAPRGVDTGSIRIQAVAIYPNEERSSVTSRLVEYDTRRPEKPTAEIVSRKAGSATLRFQAEGARYYRYETSVNGEVADPSVRSPRSGEELRLRFPRGLSAPVTLSVAAEDRAGNLSGGRARINFYVDTIPPPAPDISIDKGEAAINGEETLYYSVASAPREDLLPSHPGAMQDFTPYERSISLEGESGKKTVYRLWAYAEDQAGNRSGLSSSEVYTIDRRRPTIPDIIGTTEKNVHNEPVSVSLASEAGDEAIEYRLTEIPQSSDVDTPDTGESFRDYKGPLMLEGREGERIEYLLEYRGKVDASEEASEVRSERFVIDRDPPGPPRLQGISEGGEYSHPVMVRGSAQGGRVWVWAAGREEAEEVRASYSADEVPARAIRNRGRPVDSGALISCPDGQRRSYSVFSVSCDAAGNCTKGESVYRIAIDRDKPGLPELKGLPSSGLTAENVRLVAESETADFICYEVRTNRTVPPIPGSHSRRSDEPLTFEGRDGERVVYTMRYRGADAAGNLSSEVGHLHWVIDRRTPAPPAIHTSQLSSNLFSVEMRDSADGEQLYYTADGGRYIRYPGPFFYRVEGKSSQGLIRAYAASRTGVQSEVVRTELLELPASVSLVKGIKDGRAYAEDVQVIPRKSEFTGDTELRYELRLNNRQPTGPFSPLFPEQLTLSAVRGQSQDYVLSVGVHSNEDGTALRRESYRITIDKAAPPVPQITGVENGAYFTGPQKFRLSLPEDEGTIRYSLTRREDPVQEYRRYDGSVLEAGGPQGTMREYRLSFFAVDEVGNRSEMRDVYFTVDRDGIYVSPEGSDRAAGGRSDPFRSLQRGIQEAAESDRSTIVLAAGDYRLHSPITAADGLTIKGGYQRSEWGAAEGQSFISLAESFPADAPAVDLSGGNLTLERVLLNTSNRTGTVMRLTDGSTLHLKAATLVTGSGKAAPLLESRNSSFNSGGSRIDLGPVSDGTALHFVNSGVKMRDTAISGGQNEGRVRLVTLENSETSFRDCVIDPGSGRHMTALEVQGGTLNVQGGTVYSGAAGLRSTLLRISEAQAALTGAALETSGSNSGGRLVTGVSGQDAEIAFNESKVRLSGFAGAAALETEESRLSLRGSTVQTGGQREFAYHIRSTGGSLDAENTLFTSGTTFDNIMLDLRNSDNTLRQVTLVHLGGERIANSVRVSGGTLLISSSVIAGSGGSPGTALLMESLPNELTVENNIFSGWPLLLQHNGTAAQTIDELEEPRRQYPGQAPFGGNRAVPRQQLFRSEKDYTLSKELQDLPAGYSAGNNQ
jgi:hypothetical protein